MSTIMDIHEAQPDALVRSVLPGYSDRVSVEVRDGLVILVIKIADGSEIISGIRGDILAPEGFDMLRSATRRGLIKVAMEGKQ